MFDSIEDKNNTDKIFNLFVNPYIELIHKNANNGISVNKNPLVLGSSIIIADLVLHMNKVLNEELIHKILNQILFVLMKYKIESPYLFEAITSVLEQTKLESISDKLQYIYERIVSILNSNSSANYLTKIECCNILSALARLINQTSDKETYFKNYYDEVIASLKNACNDRVSKVQIAASECLKEWLIFNNNANESIKSPSAVKDKSPQLSSSRLNKLNLLRNLSKLNRDNISSRTLSPENIKEEIYSKGISSLLKTDTFLKNRENSKLKKSEWKKNSKEKDKMGKTFTANTSTDFIRTLKKESMKNNKNGRDDDDIQIYFKEKRNSIKSNINCNDNSNEQTRRNKSSIKEVQVDDEQEEEKLKILNIDIKNDSHSNAKEKPLFLEEENIGDEMIYNNSKVEEDEQENLEENEEENNDDNNDIECEDQSSDLQNLDKIDQSKIQEHEEEQVEEEENKESYFVSKLSKNSRPSKLSKDSKNSRPSKLSKDSKNSRPSKLSKDSNHSKNSRQSIGHNELPQKSSEHLKRFTTKKTLIPLHKSEHQSSLDSIPHTNIELTIKREIEFSIKRKPYKLNIKKSLLDGSNFFNLLENFESETLEKINLMNNKLNSIKAKLSDPNIIKERDKNDAALHFRTISASEILDREKYANITEENAEKENNTLTDSLNIINPNKDNNTNISRTLTNDIEAFDKIYNTNPNVLYINTLASCNNLTYSPIISQWQQILKEIENNNLNKAFEEALSLGDDILLLRLIFMTGPCLDYLDKNISIKLLMRCVLICRCSMIQQIVYEFIKQAVDLKMFEELNFEDKNETLELLDNFSAFLSPISERSSILYKQILN